jgi:hypothetical protein
MVFHEEVLKVMVLLVVLYLILVQLVVFHEEVLKVMVLMAVLLLVLK